MQLLERLVILTENANQTREEEKMESKGHSNVKDGSPTKVKDMYGTKVEKV